MANVKVNVGCGSRVVADWINYDSSIHLILSKYHFLKRILYAFRLIPRKVYTTNWPYELIERKNLRKGLPLYDESVDFIFSSHFLEHLSYKDGINLLKDCHRVLKPGGWIRVVCPDLRVITSKYLEGDMDYVLFQVSQKADLSHAFIKSLCLSDSRSLLERIFFPGSLHRCMYDFDSLSNLLAVCGFSIIEKRKYREGVTPDIDKLDNRSEESLYVEAQKF
jgi:predicted SAM-dependent methyltransferase